VKPTISPVRISGLRTSISRSRINSSGIQSSKPHRSMKWVLMRYEHKQASFGQKLGIEQTFSKALFVLKVPDQAGNITNGRGVTL